MGGWLRRWVCGDEVIIKGFCCCATDVGISCALGGGYKLCAWRWRCDQNVL
jgi:hypothetical protein